MPVSADDTALRRVPPLMVVADPKVQGGKRASSAVFKDDRDGSSMSVYLDSAVRALGLETRDVLHGKSSGWAVAAIPVAVLVAEEQRVVRDPVFDSVIPHPCDLAHALVEGAKKERARLERISRKSPLVYVSP